MLLLTDQVAHQIQCLRVDVVGAGGEYWAEDGLTPWICL